MNLLGSSARPTSMTPDERGPSVLLQKKKVSLRLLAKVCNWKYGISRRGLLRAWRKKGARLEEREVPRLWSLLIGCELLYPVWGESLRSLKRGSLAAEVVNQKLHWGRTNVIDEKWRRSAVHGEVLYIGPSNMLKEWRRCWGLITLARIDSISYI